MNNRIEPRVGDIWRFTYEDGDVHDVLVTHTEIVDGGVRTVVDMDWLRCAHQTKGQPPVLLYRCPDGHYRGTP